MLKDLDAHRAEYRSNPGKVHVLVDWAGSSKLDDRLVAEMADSMEGLSGVTAQSMADEDRANAQAFHMENAAAGLTQTPLLVLTSDDGLAPHSDALVHAIEAKGGHKITAIHVATDHSWSDHRIALESAILTWLAGLH